MTPFLRILIADNASARRRSLEEFLGKTYESVALEITLSDRYGDVVKMTGAEGKDWSGIFLAEGLPGSPTLQRAITEISAHLNSHGRGACVFGMSDKSYPGMEIPNVAHLLMLGPKGGVPATVAAVIKSKFPPPIPLPNLKVVPGKDVLSERDFRETIRSLDAGGDLERAKTTLKKIVRGIFPQAVGIRLFPLSQGFSGSRVFRATIEMKAAPQVDCVIKLTRMEDHWKIANEISQWEALERALSNSGYIRMLPKLFRPPSTDGAAFGVEVGNWFGSACHFLGELGDMSSLETYYHAHPALDAMTSIYMEIIKDLKKAWYTNGESVRVRGKLWDGKDAVLKRVSGIPPFRFSGPHKARLLGSLNEFSESARHHFSLSEAEITEIAECIESGFDFPQPAKFVQSMVHGDLNCNNILVMEEKKMPFFIDFAFAHSGLMVQDFARMEIELKFKLMDARHPQVDITIGDALLPGWVNMETYLAELLGSRKLQEKPKQANAKFDNQASEVPKIRSLVLMIREQASLCHAGIAKSGKGVHFRTEYSAALLYHTLRAIGFENLPHPKRLLAVKSASLLCAQLKSKARPKKLIRSAVR